MIALQKGNSSDEELEGDGEGEESERPPPLRTPLVELVGHSNVVMSADWLPGGEQAVTASWDRTASLFDVETGEMVQTLSGELCSEPHAIKADSQYFCNVTRERRLKVIYR